MASALNGSRLLYSVRSSILGVCVDVWQDSDGNKMINEYVWRGKIGTGSYGKVVSL